MKNEQTMRSSVRYSRELTDETCRSILEEVIRTYGDQHYTRSLKARYPDVYGYIENRFPELAGRKFAEKCYWLLTGIRDFPKCAACGKKVRLFVNRVEGYAKTCSMECGNRWKFLSAVQERKFEISTENDKKFRREIEELELDFCNQSYLSRLLRECPDAVNYVHFRYAELADHKFAEKLYWFVHGMTEYPVCPICGLPLTKTQFINIRRGYSEHHHGCDKKELSQRKKIGESHRLRMQDPVLHAVTVEKRKKTKFEKYGDPNWNNAELAMQTRRENNGGLLWTDEMKQKQKRTLLERYGDENWNNQEKKRQTCLEKYGVVSYSQTDEFIEKTKATNLAHRGVEFPSQCEECRERQRQTNLEKYGTEYYAQSGEFHALWKDPAFVENR